MGEGDVLDLFSDLGGYDPDSTLGEAADSVASTASSVGTAVQDTAEAPVNAIKSGFQSIVDALPNGNEFVWGFVGVVVVLLLVLLILGKVDAL